MPTSLKTVLFIFKVKMHQSGSLSELKMKGLVHTHTHTQKMKITTLFMISIMHRVRGHSSARTRLA